MWRMHRTSRTMTLPHSSWVLGYSIADLPGTHQLYPMHTTFDPLLLFATPHPTEVTFFLIVKPLLFLSHASPVNRLLPDAPSKSDAIACPYSHPWFVDSFFNSTVITSGSICKLFFFLPSFSSCLPIALFLVLFHPHKSTLE